MVNKNGSMVKSMVKFVKLFHKFLYLDGEMEIGTDLKGLLQLVVRAFAADFWGIEIIIV